MARNGAIWETSGGTPPGGGPAAQRRRQPRSVCVWPHHVHILFRLDGGWKVGAPLMRRMIGRSDHTIDDKGRMVLPSIHRERFEAGAVLLARGSHIAVFEPSEWDGFIERLEALSGESRLTRTELNLILMDAADLKPDSAGRILIPAWMREQVGLDRDVMLGGNREYLGIYPRNYLDNVDPKVRGDALARVDSVGI